MPTLIHNATELQNINLNLAGSYELANDIDMTGFSWSTIFYFNGSLDGAGYKISNLTVAGNFGVLDYPAYGADGDSASFTNLKIENLTSPAGFIGTVGGGNAGTVLLFNIDIQGIFTNNTAGVLTGALIGTITGMSVLGVGHFMMVIATDITVHNSTFSGNQAYGGVFGRATYGATVNLTNVKATNITVNLNTGSFGGLIGQSDYCTAISFNNCRFTGTVNAIGGGEKIGGFMYYALVAPRNPPWGVISSTLTMNKCGANFTINSLSVSVGGGFFNLSWRLPLTVQIQNSYGICTVNDGVNSILGGFIGTIQTILGASFMDLENVYAVTVGTATTLGGVVANSLGGASCTTTGVFWDSTVGPPTSLFGVGISTADLQSKTYLVAQGWDFTTIWAISPTYNNGYPNLDGVRPKFAGGSNSAKLLAAGLI